MAYEVQPGNVEWVCSRVLKSLDGGQFNHGEVILGIAEALGRVVVSSAETPVQGTQAAQVILAHLNSTIAAGYSAKGYNMGSGQ